MSYLKLTDVPKQDNWSSNTSINGRYVVVIDNCKVKQLNAKEGSSIVPQLGKLSDLSTENKDTLVDAINELDEKIDSKQSNKYTIVEEILNPSSEYSKVYRLMENEQAVGASINIPKDMVVSSGDIETNPEGQPEGTYLVLTLANATSDKIYIDVKDLVGAVYAGKSTKEVNITISDSNEISADINIGSIDRVKLDPITQLAITKAETSIQSVTSGSANGTISVDDNDVAVKGLGTAAYKNDTDFASQGIVNAVMGQLNAVMGQMTADAEQVTELTTSVNDLTTKVDSLSSEDSKPWMVFSLSNMRVVKVYDDTGTAIYNDPTGSSVPSSDVFSKIIEGMLKGKSFGTALDAYFSYDNYRYTTYSMARVCSDPASPDSLYIDSRMTIDKSMSDNGSSNDFTLGWLIKASRSRAFTVLAS